MDKIKDEDLDSNVKLLEWFERKFHIKVLGKISSFITLRHVDLETKMESVKTIVENIFSLYTKLCNVDNFTQETCRYFDQLYIDLQHTGNTLKLTPSQSQVHF